MNAETYPEFRLENREAFVRDPHQLAHKWTMLPFETPQELSIELGNADDYKVDYLWFGLDQENFYKNPQAGKPIHEKLVELERGKRGRRFRITGLTDEGCYHVAARRTQEERWPKCTFTVVVLKAHEVFTRFFVVSPPAVGGKADPQVHPRASTTAMGLAPSRLDQVIKQANENVLLPYCNVKVVPRPTSQITTKHMTSAIPNPIPSASMGSGEPAWLRELSLEATNAAKAAIPYSVFFVGAIAGGDAGHTWDGHLTIIDGSKEPAGLILAHEAGHYLNSVDSPDQWHAMGLDADGGTHISSNGWLMYFDSSDKIGTKLTILHAININRIAARLSLALGR